MAPLPIDEVLPELRGALRAFGAAVLQAPPGAGKTTHVPLALLGEPWLAGRTIVMLEPRRVAARAAARRMASTLGEPVGRTVGFRVRSESRVGAQTRVEVVTEGVLTRMLQNDPALERVGLVIFDEFHERSLHADLGLTLALQSRELLREDLRLLVMSATLDGAPVASLLGSAPLVTSLGRSHPVETSFLPRPVEGRVEPAAARVVRDALRDCEGDVLVFLPGAGEIRRTEELLLEAGPLPGVDLFPLYGDLAQEAQERALAPAAPDRRKVVLATSIAETSLTIEGVRVVVDSGLMRVPRFSPRTGMTRLETLPVTRASADQRRGRAGRTAPGVCYRLWTAAADQGLVPHGAPEILSADLSPLALELAAWGASDPAELAWLDTPPAAAYSQARELLEALGALAAGGITPHGRAMAGLGAHPRLAHMLLTGLEIGHGALACDLAALLSDRDPIRTSPGSEDADVRVRVSVLARGGDPRADRGALHRVREESARWRRRLGVEEKERDVEACGVLLALAYPDRISQRRPGKPGRYLLRNGRGASLAGSQALQVEPYLAVADLDGQGRDSRIYRAAPISEEEIVDTFGEQVRRWRGVEWDAEAGAVRAREQDRLGAIVLRDGPLSDPAPEEVVAALCGGIAREGLDVLPWTKGARQLQQRIRFLASLYPGFPEVADDALTSGLERWLAPYLWGIRRREELKRLNLEAMLLGLLDREQRARLEEEAPTHFQVPSGSRITIDYSAPDAPSLAVRLQEVFGQLDTPRIARGRVPLTLHLLSPAQRPVQVTKDLASFWATTYFEVRKDLRGRYPKHSWPENPLEAEPTRRARADRTAQE